MSFEATWKELGGAWRSDGNARMSLEELRGGWRSHGNRPYVSHNKHTIHKHITFLGKDPPSKNCKMYLNVISKKICRY